LKGGYALNNIRFRFIRGEEVKFISHLDLMKVFERALRRSRIPIAHSQGYNPHPHMVFGLPLSVGVTSEAEYADFEFSIDLNLEEFIVNLNNQLPYGLKLLEAKEKNNKVNIMASIVMSSYDLLVYSETINEENEMNSRIAEFIGKAEIIVKKEGKNGSKNIDIKPMIRKIEVRAAKPDELSENMSLKEIETERVFCISVVLSAGSVANLKPELLIAALNDIAELRIKSLKIHRTGLFVSKDGKTMNPLDDSALSG